MKTALAMVMKSSVFGISLILVLVPLAGCSGNDVDASISVKDVVVSSNADN